MKIALLVLLIWLNACNHAPGKNSVDPQDSLQGNKDSPHVSRDSPVITPDQNKASTMDTSVNKAARPARKGEYLLSYKNDSLEQQLKLVEINKNLMTFRLITANIHGGFSDTISGRLTYVESGGDETDHADDLHAFFYSYWNFKDKKTGCRINFKIDDDGFRYIRVQDYNCSYRLDHRCPIESGGVLKRVDIR
jgi:hypothetical protein